MLSPPFGSPMELSHRRFLPLLDGGCLTPLSGLKTCNDACPSMQASDEIMILSAVGFTAHRHDFPESQQSGVLTP